MASAHDLTETKICAWPGCPDTTAGGRGWQAKYCAHHAREAQSSHTKRGIAAKRNGKSHEDRAKGVVRAAKALDVAKARAEEAVRAYEAAKIAYANAVQELT